jgi:hypothetical protein
MDIKLLLEVVVVDVIKPERGDMAVNRKMRRVTRLGVS